MCIQHFSTYAEHIYFTRLMDYKIYELSDGHAPQKTYSIDFGSANWPEEINSLAKADKLSFIEKANYIQYIDYFQETDDFVIIGFNFGGQNRLGLYNKQEKTTQVYALAPLTQPYFFSFGKLIGMNEQAIFTLVVAYSMLNFLKGKNGNNDFEGKYPEQIKRLRKALQGIEITETSNPFLITYTIN